MLNLDLGKDRKVFFFKNVRAHAEGIQFFSGYKLKLHYYEFPMLVRVKIYHQVSEVLKM